jgi:hypothetical protein
LSVLSMFVNGSKTINLYRRPSIDATYDVSVHLAKRFQSRRFFRNRPISNKNCLCRPCLLTDPKWAIFCYLPSSFCRQLVKPLSNQGPDSIQTQTFKHLLIRPKKKICVFTVTLIFASDPMHFYTEFG